MPPLSLLIKPASGNCNLRCKYCFYRSIAESRETESYGMMDIETLEVIVKSAFQYAEHICTFAFQGGEPTLVGLNFFEKLIEFEKLYNRKKIKVNNVLQTNGIVINNEWANFFALNNFLVGISLDGHKEIHDANRVDIKNKSSFMRVMRTVRLFDKHKVEYNILSVVSACVARHINKIYNFFKKNNFRYLQFIPCLDPLSEKPGAHNYSLTPERYTEFLKNLFDLWYNDLMAGKMISIRNFDNYIDIFMGYRPEACGMTGECQCQFVIEGDGGVYPCDFYVIDKWYLGNIKELGLSELRNCDITKHFIELSQYVDPKCNDCRWSNLCRGGCRRTREPFEGSNLVLNYFCPSYLEFFDYTTERMQQLARIFARR